MSNPQIDNQEYDVHPEIKKHLAAEAPPEQADLSTASTPAETETPEPAGDQQEIVQQPVEQPQETEQQKHFKKLRQQAYKAERERDELARRLKQIEESQQQYTTPEPTYNQPADVNQRMAYLEQQVIQSRITAQYPDFDSVVSPENIAALRREHPDIAASLSSSNDLYATALSAYKMIKTFGIHDTNQDINYNKQRLAENANKPRSTSSISPQRGESPLAKANEFAQGLTDDLKQKLYQQMRDAQRNG